MVTDSCFPTTALTVFGLRDGIFAVLQPNSITIKPVVVGARRAAGLPLRVYSHPRCEITRAEWSD